MGSMQFAPITHKLINSNNNSYEKTINCYPIIILAEHDYDSKNKRQQQTESYCYY